MIAFTPRVHGVPSREATERARYLLERVGLEPKRFAGRYPHELSGGQRQREHCPRAGAAAAPGDPGRSGVGAGQVGRAQVLNLLLDLKAEFDLTYVFISHDLNVIRYLCDRVMVMYLGKVVEIGDTEQVYANPAHPYTRALLASMPSMDPDHRTLAAPLAGDPPNPINPPPAAASTRAAPVPSRSANAARRAVRRAGRPSGVVPDGDARRRPFVAAAPHDARPARRHALNAEIRCPMTPPLQPPHLPFRCATCG
jgi:peptide/nickel transport system ATP-binding protein